MQKLFVVSTRFSTYTKCVRINIRKKAVECNYIHSAKGRADGHRDYVRFRWMFYLRGQFLAGCWLGTLRSSWHR